MKTFVILGPTCSGKSDTAVSIAEKTDAEIISCDSMQVYRGLEIGTAQPTMDETKGIPHHLIGMMDIAEPYDVNKFVQFTKQKLEELKAKKRNAVIVGGTGLYAKSLVYSHGMLPADSVIAAAVQKQLASENGRRELENEIIAAAGRQEDVPEDVLLNPRRLARAVEVLRLTGRLPWHIQSSMPETASDYRQIILMPELDELRGRIRLRTEKMMKAGWLEEAQLAIGKGLMTTPTARQALGYREIDDFLSGRGNAHTTEELSDLIALKTAQFARRQLTWFRHQHPGSEQIPIKPDYSPDKMAENILYGTAGKMQ